MAQVNHLEIYKFLQKSNCRECRLPTCLAFAVAVMNGEKSLDACPHVESGVVEQFQGKVGKRPAIEDDLEEALAELRNQLAAVDFSASAERLGAVFADGKLTIKCLGKDFSVDPSGNLASVCHINTWLSIPLFNYIIHSSGKAASGKWVPFRELKNGETWGRLFRQRCELPLKQVIDNYTDLFEVLINIFAGTPTVDGFSSDIAVVIHPLPKLPMLISYWKQEGDFDSTLSLFFDATAEDNLNIDSIYRLGVGLVTMFEKIALTHERFT